MSVLKWIWGLLQKMWHFIDHLARFLVDIFSSVLAWIIAGLAWVVHSIFHYLGEFFYNFFAQLEDVTTGSLPAQPLADWLGRDVLALDVGWECIIIIVSLWFAAKIARLGVTPIRVLIDLI